MYVTQHWFICHPSDYTVSEDAGIEPMRTVATLEFYITRQLILQLLDLFSGKEIF
jgi:hypothetical protein